MTTKRFVEIVSIETIKDTETGEKYVGIIDSAFIDLVNKLHEELEPIRTVCTKYNIPLKDLPEILEEYIAYDNDDNW